MSRSYVDTFFRHKYVLVLPIVLGFLVGGLAATNVPREYVASASIWTDTQVPSESTVGATASEANPAAGQATYLTQLLGTRGFMRSVVEMSPLAEEYRSQDRLGGDMFLFGVAATVAVSTPGPQLLGISVRRVDPSEAIGITEAVLTAFEDAQIDAVVTRAKEQTEYLREQAELAKTTAATSGTRAATEQWVEAQAALGASESAIARAEAQGLDIVDQPDVAYPQARRKLIVLGAGGGLLAGLSLSLATLIMFMARDKSVRGEDDAQAALDVEVLGSFPEFPQEHVHLDDLPVGNP